MWILGNNIIYPILQSSYVANRGHCSCDWTEPECGGRIEVEQANTAVDC